MPLFFPYLDISVVPIFQPIYNDDNVTMLDLMGWIYAKYLWNPNSIFGCTTFHGAEVLLSLPKWQICEDFWQI